MPRPALQHVFARRVSGDPGLTEKLLDLVGRIPPPREGKAADPDARAREIARKASVKAAASAGTLALPPGPLGWLTIAPELYAVWKIQAQMVADIAGAHGRPELLTREQMLYCLFGHTAADAFRDRVIRMGERYVVRRTPLSALYAIGNTIALRIAQRSAGRVIGRWVPGLGALGVAGYVYIDTGRVADTTIELFTTGVRIEGELEAGGVVAIADAEEGRATSASRAKTTSRSSGPRAAPGKRTRAKPSRSTPAETHTSAKPGSGDAGTPVKQPSRSRPARASTARKQQPRTVEAREGGGSEN